MDAKYEAAIGGLYLFMAAFAHFAQDIFPIITFVAALTGAILGCHGVYLLIYNRIHKIKNHIHENYYHGEHHNE